MRSRRWRCGSPRRSHRRGRRTCRGGHASGSGRGPRWYCNWEQVRVGLREIVRIAGVDGIEVREIAAVGVALRVADALVAQAEVAGEVDARGPFGVGAGRGPVVLLRGGEDFLLDLLAQLPLDDLGHIADALGAGGRCGGCCSGCGLGGFIGLDGGVPGGFARNIGLVLGLLDEQRGLLLGEQLLLDHGVDQVDHRVRRRRLLARDFRFLRFARGRDCFGIGAGSGGGRRNSTRRDNVRRGGAAGDTTAAAPSDAPGYTPGDASGYTSLAALRSAILSPRARRREIDRRAWPVCCPIPWARAIVGTAPLATITKPAASKATNMRNETVHNEMTRSELTRDAVRARWCATSSDEQMSPDERRLVGVDGSSLRISN